MGWGSAIGVVVLTTIAGGLVAAGLAAFLIQALQISGFEGGSGYFFFFVTGAGVVVGFLVGLVSAATVRSGFLAAQGYALGGVVTLALLVGIFSLVFQDKRPMLDGDTVTLEVELKCPHGWTPDNFARSELGASCLLQRDAADGDRGMNPITLGGLTVPAAPESDGQWVIPCSVGLLSGRYRYLRISVGNKADATIRVPMPARPSASQQQWSAWSNAGFLPQPGNPAAPDYAYRFRFQRSSDYEKAHPRPEDTRQKALAAMPANAAVADWLPFFEDERGNAANHDASHQPEVDAVNAHPEELIALLRSKDPTTVRRAVFAAGTLTPFPAALTEPLAEAGRLTIDMIRQARATSAPGDPDLRAEDRAYRFFFYWDLAIARAGAAGTPARRKVLEAIGQEVAGETGRGGIHMIADGARKSLDDLGGAAAPAR